MDIKWLDGQPATGMFILEMLFENGGKGYLKNADYQMISHWYTSLWSNTECVSMTLYDPSLKVIAAKNRPGVNCAA